MSKNETQSKKAASREEKLAQALRENLKKRKAQARDRKVVDESKKDS